MVTNSGWWNYRWFPFTSFCSYLLTILQETCVAHITHLYRCFYYFRNVFFDIPKIILQQGNKQGVDWQPVNKRTSSSLWPGLGVLVSGRDPQFAIGRLSPPSCSWPGWHGEGGVDKKEKDPCRSQPMNRGKTQPLSIGDLTYNMSLH